MKRVETIVTKDNLSEFYGNESGHLFMTTDNAGADYDLVKDFSKEQCERLLDGGVNFCFVSGEENRICAVNISNYICLATKAILEANHLLDTLSSEDYEDIKMEAERDIDMVIGFINGDFINPEYEYVKPDKVYIYQDGAYHGQYSEQIDKSLLISPHDIASGLIDYVEDVLDRKDIIIPDEDRMDDEGEANLYGMTYSDFVDDIEEVITENLMSWNDYTPLTTTDEIRFLAEIEKARSNIDEDYLQDEEEDKDL